MFGFVFISQGLALIPGRLGIYIRRVWYGLTLRRCGQKIAVDWLGVIRTPKAEIGDNVYIGIGCYVGNASIGDRTQIACGSVVLSGRHNHKMENGKLIPSENVGHITIGSDCWIGARAIIGADVANNTTVGANAYVNRIFDPNSVIAGVPAVFIKTIEARR